MNALFHKTPHTPEEKRILLTARLDKARIDAAARNAIADLRNENGDTPVRKAEAILDAASAVAMLAAVTLEVEITKAAVAAPEPAPSAAEIYAKAQRWVEVNEDGRAETEEEYQELSTFLAAHGVDRNRLNDDPKGYLSEIAPKSTPVDAVEPLIPSHGNSPETVPAEPAVPAEPPAKSLEDHLRAVHHGFNSNDVSPGDYWEIKNLAVSAGLPGSLIDSVECGSTLDVVLAELAKIQAPAVEPAGADLLRAIHESFTDKEISVSEHLRRVNAARGFGIPEVVIRLAHGNADEAIALIAKA